MRFHTKVLLGGKTATGIEVPADVVEALGAGKRPPVRVTINGFTYRTTVAVMGGVYLVPLAAENRAGAGVASGDEVDVDIALDTEPRQVTVPADLAEALDRDAEVRRRFDASAYSRRKEVVRSVEEAKTPETRERRIAKAVAALADEAPAG
jgi:hypothetical protein